MCAKKRHKEYPFMYSQVTNLLVNPYVYDNPSKDTIESLKGDKEALVLWVELLVLFLRYTRK